MSPRVRTPVIFRTDAPGGVALMEQAGLLLMAIVQKRWQKRYDIPFFHTGYAQHSPQPGGDEVISDVSAGKASATEASVDKSANAPIGEV